MIRLSVYCLFFFFFFFLNTFLLKWHLSANLSGPVSALNTRGPSSATAPRREAPAAGVAGLPAMPGATSAAWVAVS